MGLWVFLSELSGIDLYCCFDKHPIKDETLLMLPSTDWLLMFSIIAKEKAFSTKS